MDSHCLTGGGGGFKKFTGGLLSSKITDSKGGPFWKIYEILTSNCYSKLMLTKSIVDIVLLFFRASATFSAPCSYQLTYMSKLNQKLNTYI
jgi:hypothetical protein